MLNNITGTTDVYGQNTKRHYFDPILAEMNGLFPIKGGLTGLIVTLVSEPSYRLAMFNTGAIGV